LELAVNMVYVGGRHQDRTGMMVDRMRKSLPISKKMKGKLAD
jgi:hypothetical protein